MTLNTRAWLGLALLAAVMGLLLFGTAGSIRYWQAWTFLVVYFGLAAAITRDLMRRDPALLARRMKGGPTGEPRPAQRIIMVAVSIGFVALLIVAALDFRFHWSAVPAAVVVLGNVPIVIGMLCIARVYRENSYSSATVEISEGQRVIDTGPYAIVRHPMYATALLYLAGTPLALGSYRAFAPLALIIPALIWRIADEEQLLTRDLAGYADYKARVRYRIIPGIW